MVVGEATFEASVAAGEAGGNRVDVVLLLPIEEELLGVRHEGRGFFETVAGGGVKVDPERVVVAAATFAGLFYAVEGNRDGGKCQ